MNDNVLLADLNPRTDGLDCPVYRQPTDAEGKPFRGEITPWYVFASPEEEVEFDERFYAVTLSFEEENVKEHAAESAALLKNHPRACRAYARLLKAEKLAKRIVDEELGVPLTRTWATEVLRDEPPFQR
ncbi:MAG TPA: hypothetical protein VEB43_03595 [Anaeromyxobacter sp.]|nr:hypothetical protein [Anaeromyxobacter sp.]